MSIISPSSNILLITGTPGIGKTTVIKNTVASLASLKISGFYTEEIRINNVRLGFELVTLDNDRFVMAHVGNDSPSRVGKYGVNVEAIDEAVRRALPDGRNAEVFIIDEIGKMECFSHLFVQRISSLLDSGRPVVATIALKGSGFISRVKNKPSVALWEVTRKNRNEMPEKIVAWIKSILDYP